MFTLKQWNAVAMCSWDVECDTCAICRVQIMDACLRCQTKSKQHCGVVGGECNHLLHDDVCRCASSSGLFYAWPSSLCSLQLGDSVCKMSSVHDYFSTFMSIKTCYWTQWKRFEVVKKKSRWGRDFPPVQTGPGAHLASCIMGTGPFPGVKCGRGVLLTTHHLPVPRSWKSRAIPLPKLWTTPCL